MTTGRINQVARPRGLPTSVVTLRFHLRGKANATAEPVVAFVRALLILHEGRIIGLRILPRNCGEVEARHEPGYRHFRESMFPPP